MNMNPSSYSDEALVRAIQGKDAAARNNALKTLYMNPAITNKVRELTKMYGNHKHDPDDILQEGIILTDRLIREGKFQQKSKISTFLISVCRNILRSNVKKVDRIEMRETIEDKDQKELVNSPEEDMIVVEQTADKSKRDNVLQDLLKQITPNCQENLRLYYFEEKNMAQVAEARQLKNANQAKKAMSRCREQLRKLIKEHRLLEQFLKLSL